MSSRINGISRARVLSRFRSGLMSVNGHIINKDGKSKELRFYSLSLNIIGWLVQGLLVRVSVKDCHLFSRSCTSQCSKETLHGILHHCKLATVCFSPEALTETDNDSGDQDGHSHNHLAEQFEKHNMNRVYLSITCGLPSPLSNRIGIDIPKVYNLNSRIQIIANPELGTVGKARNPVTRGIMTCNLYNKASFHSCSLVSLTESNGFYRTSNIPSASGTTGAGARSPIHSGLLHFINRTNPSSLSQVRQTHAQLLRTGLCDLHHYRTKLISFYSNFHHFSDAKNLLLSLPKPDLLSFTALINAFSKCNDFEYTLSLFSYMLMNGLDPDARVIPSIIKACAGLLMDKIGKQVHGFSFASGFSTDPFVESSLLHFYVKCDDLDGAHKLFDGMAERDVVSWSALVAAYARKGDVKNVKKVFGEINLGFEPNIVSWNGMIAGFNQSACFLDAVLMFQQMLSHGFAADGTSISSVLPAIGDLGYLSLGTQVHGYAIKTGFAVDKCIVSALINMYSKCGCVLEMRRAFEDIDQGDVGACNALIAGLARHGLVDQAVKVFKDRRGRGMDLNVISWTSVIACCSQHGKDIEALNLFREMQSAGVRANSVTIPCLLPACGNIAALMHGKAAHCFSVRRDISRDVYVGSALIDMYANCGNIQAARFYFDRMPARNLVCWNAMLGAYAMHGKANEAIEIFQSLLRNGQKPDSFSFISLLSACSQSGLTEEGQHYFEIMSRDYGLEARVEHYACMVNLLGRAGKLLEAYSMINKMPLEPDASVWGSLLSSCRLHHDMSLGEVAAGKLFELEPGNPGNYILLSNIYAYKRKWEEVDRVRNIMRDKGLRKNPGCSWIEVKNKVYMILAGDRSLPQMVQILDKLDKLSMEMRKAGYMRHTSDVLQDVEEQEKEHILCGHSEKLAVVFGLLNTSQGSTLRVTKNLRICGDCHVVIKFISQFERREIFVRDTNRYHHFKDGDCSCGDYW